jgi:hypothetical protein
LSILAGEEGSTELVQGDIYYDEEKSKYGYYDND